MYVFIEIHPMVHNLVRFNSIYQTRLSLSENGVDPMQTGCPNMYTNYDNQKLLGSCSQRQPTLQRAFALRNDKM
jgi:hypothetical protein